MDEDEIRLPEDTLRILQEFLKEKQEREAQEATQEGQDIETFEENWQLSQFWYDDTTKQTLARLCRRIIETEGWSEKDTKIGLLSCPSLFTGVRDLLTSAQVLIFEYDQRFSSYGDNFVHYDYTEAGQDGVLEQFNGYFDILILDPPFLSEECIEKMSRIVRKFSKEHTKVVLCSGLVVKDFVEQHMKLQLQEYEPTHQRNLGNQFASYANFNLDKVLQGER